MYIKTDNLVLKVSKNVDPQKLDLSKYDDFLDELCGHREYQKEAIQEAVRFLLGGEYKNTEELARENFDQNSDLQEYYGTFENLRKRLELKDKLACTIDLATATGKSWVIYGIGQILLCEGAVDQVLVLCPSVTIEEGLTSKFRKFAIDKNLKATLPGNSAYKNPRIINASKTIEKGDICIENIHAVYIKTGSSIRKSLDGKGERTLILNDEAHHIMNPKEEIGATEKTGMKKWKEFLIDPKYNFKYIVNFSGTPYIGNNYFTDVIYRYNIMQAMEGQKAGNFVIKKVNYVQRDTAINESERFQIIYKNHLDNKKKYPLTKPLTIFVTQRIAGAEKLSNKLKDFLIEKEKINLEKADKKVIVVTSSPKHKEFVEELKKVDNPKNPVEWIVSVSMLTEGWDVSNVFQIVPHEQRAFNSKLLIAQVLGRGLRVPKGYEIEQPEVIVYNHAKWSGAIADLVREVMAYEKRVRSYIVDKEPDYNFELLNIKPDKKEITSKKHPVKGPIAIPKIPVLSDQSKIVKRKTTYFRIKEAEEKVVTTEVEIKLYPVDEVVNDIFDKLAIYDQETGTDYSKIIKKEKVRKDILNALKRAKDKTGMLTEQNRNRIQRAFDVLKREVVGTTNIEMVYEKPFIIKTKEIRTDSVSFSDLKKNKAIIYEKSSVEKSKEEDIKLINEAIGEALGKNVIKVENKYLYKCPLNIVILSHSNEKDFATFLVEKEYAEKIDAWIKSVDKGFYSVQYSFRAGSESSLERKGGHQKWVSFNPDFFTKIGKDILAIEIKSDEDITEVNKGKLRWAKRHFEELNKKQKRQNYHFYFLSPADFSTFFEKVIKQRKFDYISNLEAELSN
ncbi:MAG: DEAD/DEAH box helicase family protein [Candidatus Pacebacteria bacterium]|nr:DEAD/DEAH box helicase family protein [Candidatus Paceibacterota bacterium]